MWRHRKQHRPQLVRFPQRLDRIEESRGRLLRSVQALDVRDGLMRLHRELKMVARGFDPSTQERLAGQPAESEVDFYRIELSRVIAQEFLGSRLLRIKIRLPGRVRPARGPSENFWRDGSHSGCNNNGNEAVAGHVWVGWFARTPPTRLPAGRAIFYI